ncbi:MAG: hypothetical protein QOE23_3550, partial [Pseudonocardiales bacterium]|nr:hypothetical protein [Pseudonocardiales bacterium]
DVTHVINYQCPEDAMTYVHRIGRTARAGKSGTSVTLVDWDDLPKWKLICDSLNLPLHEPVETYSTSDHLYLELDIPRTAKGVLPRAARTRAGLDAEAVEDLGGPDRKRPARSGAGSGRSGSGRSGRSEGSSRSRSRSEASGADAEQAERKPAASRNRRRRRTRAGAPVADASATGTSAAGASAAGAGTAEQSSAG